MKEEYEALLTFLKFIKELVVNSSKLNDDVNNNDEVCKYISKKIVEISNINLKVNGYDKLDFNKRLLIAANHRSFFDVFLLIAALNKTVPFAAAKELYKVPFLKKYLPAINCISVDRYTEDISTVKGQMNAMKQHLENDNLILFPEGECSYLNNEIQEFKKGGFMAVNKTGTLIVPTYIDIPKMNKINKWCIPTDDVSITFGDMIDPENVDGKKLNANKLTEYTHDKVLALSKKKI